MTEDEVRERTFAMPITVLEVLSAVHILTDLTLGLGTVIHDYLTHGRKCQ